MFISSYILHRALGKNQSKRSDNHPALPFYFPEDFSLKEKQFHFFSKGCLLKGSIYSNGKPNKKPIVIFFHGLGSGRLAYIRLIAEICKNGYEVFAYDNRGCGESEGRIVGNLMRSNADMRAFFSYLDSQKEYASRPRYAVGHSWGGYSSMMALSPSFHVQKAISFSGFTSYSLEISHYFPKKIRKLLLPLIRETMFFECGKDGNLDVFSPLRKTKGKLLYIQGEEDRMVPLFVGMDALKKKVPSASIEFLLVAKRGHQPYLTERGEKHYEKVVSSGILSPYEPHPISLDITLATELDPLIMKRVFDFLDC